MQRSASDVEITSETLISIKQESDSWGLGHTSLVFCGVGILLLTGVLAGAHSQVVTVGWIGLLALSVTLSLGGLTGACFAFAERKTDKVRTVFAAELDRLETATHGQEIKNKETSDETRLQLTTLTGAVRLITNRLDENAGMLAHLSMEIPLKSSSRPPSTPRPRRSRKRSQQPQAEESNVVQLPSQETLKAARGLAARMLRNRNARSEDTTEDN